MSKPVLIRSDGRPIARGESGARASTSPMGGASARLGGEENDGLRTRSAQLDNYIPVVSFPKSGNTWMRHILSNLLFDGSLDAIPDCHRQPIGDAPTTVMRNGETVRLFKTHHKRLYNVIGETEINPIEAIYLVRHPLDTFLSMLNYYFLDPDEIESHTLRSEWNYGNLRVEDPFSEPHLDAFLNAFLVFGTINPASDRVGGWAEHADYWLNRANTRFPVNVIRYEDLVERGAERLHYIAGAFDRTPEQLDTAFETAQDQTRRDGKFFWKQQPGHYVDYFTEAQLERARQLLPQELMLRLGYTI